MSAAIPARDECIQWDIDDPLAEYRTQFYLPNGLIYLDGNSLGALPRTTAQRVQNVISQEWGIDLISSWNKHAWFDLPVRVGAAIAPIIGAQTHEVIACDSTSINLFKLLSGALQLQGRRRKIISERDNFPTDLYIMQGIVELFGDRYELCLCDKIELTQTIDQDTAVVVLTHVDYRSGEILDMAELTDCAHQQGALILWDLAHSAGALPVHLNRCQVDLAVGCGYKYLNGGPGAPAFLYVAESLLNTLPAVLSGWMGHAAPFDFASQYQPAAGIRRFSCGTPPILGLAALAEGLRLLQQTDIQAIRAKSQRLGDLFLTLTQAWMPDEFTVACPRDRQQRGSQVALVHDQGYAIVRALIAHGVVGDFRAPNILRFGFAPLYLRYVDIWDTVHRLHEVMVNKSWDRPEYQTRATVT